MYLKFSLFYPQLGPNSIPGGNLLPAHDQYFLHTHSHTTVYLARPRPSIDTVSQSLISSNEIQRRVIFLWTKKLTDKHPERFLPHKTERLPTLPYLKAP
ncbi:hypothetical protein AVEN_151590-1 [Araneus ventricosus]|uniref:Uncharacterized protein n=1 Tax=Araneus ventricosus TaxID=182803 RepID=A0A4Y2HY23_ARAVE|nr:hypothetical protein AVEN_151590-1 [Araneus ventricosus]